MFGVSFRRRGSIVDAIVRERRIYSFNSIRMMTSVRHHDYMVLGLPAASARQKNIKYDVNVVME